MEMLMNYVVEMVMLGLVTLLLVLGKQYLGIQADGKIAELIKQAVSYGEDAAKDKLGDFIDDVDFQNEVVEQAVNFIASNAPKYLKMAGITKEFLKNLVEAELKNKNS